MIYNPELRPILYRAEFLGQGRNKFTLKRRTLDWAILGRQYILETLVIIILTVVLTMLNMSYHLFRTRESWLHTLGKKELGMVNFGLSNFHN